jgi:hypothetical protein
LYVVTLRKAAFQRRPVASAIMCERKRVRRKKKYDVRAILFRPSDYLGDPSLLGKDRNHGFN